jgi:Zn-dependent protease with chaperone function
MSATMPPAAAQELRPRDESPIRVERWPSEMPLLVLVALVALLVWAVAAFTIIGLVYACGLAAFFFVGHAVFVAHVRGNGVRLGPDQFPELHTAVERLSQRMALTPVPETYVMQAGGSLNAFAAKFFRSNIVVLFSDLIEECGDDEAARDMIIAHELGHIHAGHLRGTWFLLPGFFVPFLGTALSRAREYTCDRYGMAGAGRRDSALLGLAILAAGGAHGRQVNREAMARQRENLNTGWMRIGEWLSTHPPLVSRMAALDPALEALGPSTTSGTVRALGIIGAAAATPVVVTFLAVTVILGALGSPRLGAGRGRATDFSKLDDAALEKLLRDAMPEGRNEPGRSGASAPMAAAAPAPAADPVDPLPAGTDVGQELSKIQVNVDLTALAGVVEMERASGALPADAAALYAKAAQRHPGEPERRDPFGGGQRYQYEQRDGGWVLRSVGPDGKAGTADDIIRDSRQ